MNPTVDSIAAEAEKLSWDERGELVARLEEGLSAREDKAAEQAFNDELLRRIKEMDEGRDEGIPADEVHLQFRRELGL